MAELNLVLLGPPGSGKGTQGERLQSELDLPYYATGDILRAAVRDDTELGRKAKEYMESGDLVPDDLIISMIAQRICSDEAAGGFILDGFPRTVPQAEALSDECDRLERELSAAVLIDVDDDEVIRRLGGRRTCEENGHVFHVDFNPPREEGVCDIDGSRLITRDDDKPDVIRRRLEQYQDKTAPLVAWYEDKGLLKRVDGDRDPDEVADDLRGLLAGLQAREGA
jgi:adenylate kinase